ncbi:hypothetical protein ncot_02600 [Nocardioides sp. JQ2195]|uniref:hypothetical protein n=1 Tax=Nocardioides sp. JQ2195 TaxID=2592334 RepID=UPI00143E3F4C|nr:hypothetical protein [Nocardioides sp. JQ2195]QIX25603.1 hypothetical protein ncot_02600 [Nocardioides sp. JQ2195]
MASRVVLHVGLMKSGTTFIQRTLLANQAALADAGILFPGRHWRVQVSAVRDLIDHVSADANTLAPDGPWLSLVEQVRAWPGTAIISMEFLGPRTPAQVAAVVDAFSGAEIDVVVTARDLSRSITSMWTESVQNSGTLGWHDYLHAIREDTGEGRGFWRQQRVVAIVERWMRAVGRDHFTLITVPPPGGPHGVLWERFAGVAGVPMDLFDLETRNNTGIDAPSAMVMRALNERLDDVDGVDYDRFVKRGLAKQALGKRARPGPRVGLDEKWVLARSRRQIERLRELDPPVVGDLAELEARTVPGIDPGDLDAEEKLEAALDGMAALVRLWAEDVNERETRARKRRQRKERKEQR